jgi:hypothetical protein
MALTLSLSHAALATAEEADTASSGRIPLELNNNLAPVLIANVDGENVRLQFDLGNSHALVLQQSVLDAIKAVPTGEVARLQGVDGHYQAPMYKVARVTLGKQVFTEVVALLDVARQGYKPGSLAQGFLGTGLLKPYQLVLDYPRQALSLERGSSPDACQGTILPFLDGWRGEPVTKVTLDLGDATLWWDTGAPMSILSDAFVSKRGIQNTSDAVQTNRLALGGSDFGPWRFEVWEMSLPGFDGFIGHDFFAKHVVCIDFPRARLAIAE